jgi:hypothetical protein
VLPYQEEEQHDMACRSAHLRAEKVVCELVTEEKAGVPLFRNRDLKAIVDAILKYIGREFCVAQVYNHLRHCRARWVHVCRLKKMEGLGALGGEYINYHDGR